MDIGVTTSGDFVTLVATQTDGSKVTLLIPPQGIETMVVGLLGESADLSKAKLPTFAELPDLSIYAMARGVGAQDVTDRQNAFALSFLFGRTRLAIGLSKDALPQLGSALLAASADTSRAQ